MLLGAAVIAAESQAQLRIVTYNSIQGPHPGFDTVVQAIGEESYSGFAKPIDVLLLQEQNDILSPTGSTRQIVDILNGIYGPGTYASGVQVGGPPFSGIRQAIVYNTNTVELVDEIAFGSISSEGAARQTLRYQLRPVGYDSAADFYAYNNHYKASDGTSEAAQRYNEAIAVRANADALGEGAHAIFAGDFNTYRSSEPGFQHLISEGPGQANDPINQIGSWTNNSTYAQWHTQSPCENDCTGGFASGGVDDRFDFQLVTGEFLDSEGLSYIPDSYHTFGNNGSTFNNAINVGNTINFQGISSFTKTEVLNALESASDHLPVVADYQIPAMLEALAETIPSTIGVGQNVTLDLFIRNAASAITALGADELDFTFTTTGALSGGGMGVRNALDPALAFPITLDTSTQGAKSGSIIVQSSSQGAGNAFVNIPISFQVGEPNPTAEQVIARALYPNVADDLNVTTFAFGGAFTSEVPAGNLPVGSDARTLAFASTGDMFGIEDRNDAPASALLDNTAIGSPSDASGIVRGSDFANFFGVADTENNDNAGPLTATWTFDISQALGDLKVSIDMAAMGDFEVSGDIIRFETSMDGSPFSTLFEATVDEAISQDYVMESGAIRTLNDPLLMEGQLLTNSFATFTKALSGVGQELIVRFTAALNADEEVFAFRNLEISGLVELPGLAGDYNGDGFVNLADYTVWRDNLGATVDAGTGADGNGNGTIDADDYQLWKTNFGNSSGEVAGVTAQVPEPSTLATIALAAVCFFLGRSRTKLAA
ncbi:dockerin type I domain-containing protein [Aeoliella sp. SH292]|uniref:dockerin type I domain-containing protein n=1 Tax=Aeoliella sp. SH292 TaxID=3454464 RepID=UPI003F9856A5